MRKLCYNFSQNSKKGKSMVITDDMLNKLERLSALKIPESKKEEFKAELGKIVGFVEILDELDLAGLEAEVSTIKQSARLREDEPVKSEVIKDILKHAPKTYETYFEVPKIIE